VKFKVLKLYSNQIYCKLLSCMWRCGWPENNIKQISQNLTA